MKAVKAVGFLGALVALMLAGCGDGSIKSPDFESVTTLKSVDVQPAVAGQPTTLPAGTTLAYRATATFSETVQPGTQDSSGHEISERTRTEDITASADWSSGNTAVASVDKGLVTGNTVSATPVTITASYQGKSDSVSVTVTDAVLKSVVYAAETNVSRSDDDQYTVAAGNTAQFQLYGRFSDQQPADAPRLLDNARFGIQWASNAPAVASNSAVTDPNFKADGVGSAVITGTVTQLPGSVAVTGVNPTSASATLVSQAASAFCERELRAPSAKAVQGPVSAACVGCSVSDTDLAIDGDATTQATMSIPLALLMGASISFDVSDTSNPLTVGKPVGFVISRSADILSAELLSSLSVATLKNCDVDGKNCEVAEELDSAPGNDALRLALLGLVGGVPQYFVSSTKPITQAANGVRLTFQGGLIGLLATLHVQSSCAAAVTAVAPTP